MCLRLQFLQGPHRPLDGRLEISMMHIVCEKTNGKVSPHIQSLMDSDLWQRQREVAERHFATYKGRYNQHQGH